MSELFEFALRHPFLVGGSLLALIATLANEIRIGTRTSVSISTQRAVQLINQGAIVVDIRDASRYSAGHIIDAINLSADTLKTDAESRLKKKRPALVVCDNGSGSGRVAGALRAAGFENAWSLDGGYAAWERDNLPMVAERAKG